MSAITEGALLSLTTAPTFRFVTFQIEISRDLMKKLFVQEFTWRSNNVVVRGSHCMYEENQPSEFYFCQSIKHIFLVIYGCFFELVDHPQVTKETLLWSRMGKVLNDDHQNIRYRHMVHNNHMVIIISSVWSYCPDDYDNHHPWNQHHHQNHNYALHWLHQ